MSASRGVPFPQIFCVMHRDPLRQALTQQLLSLAAAGITHLPKPAPTPAKDEAQDRGAPDNQPTLPASPEESVAHDVPTALAALAKKVAKCQLCGELARSRTQTVFGVGSPTARIAFFGEAPGADEDRTGEPFVGRAGELLNRMLEKCGLRRDEVYILNVLKCRPPSNRNPSPEESVNCRPFWQRQLELIRPELICCLGTVAAHNLLEVTTPIGKLRGQLFRWRSSQVVCTYHPAYLLRNPSARWQTWDDLKLLMRQIGVELE